ncbi:DJ-1/PfpI family protein [Plastoroseomonas hellenica]|uniref:DJ-1/PfpI family protein n=1 Tax=Plastoroseomonas hellenica TaxID=2687306 RepID=UPI001BAA05FE|nr:DJ-1/PfpI family protein [Plastoroseomonas hellenica]MBR0642720.1 DJ-1/PfpI family protein [Plastoroseomonas hellenica]
MNNELSRRTLIALASLVGAGAGLPAFAQDRERSGAAGMRDLTAPAPGAPTIAMLVHPDMIALDLIGPMSVFKILRCNVQLAWKQRVPVSTDIGLPIAATHTLEEVPPTVDVLFVPGGLMGTIACMDDPEVMDFLADRGSRATWVTSVCTGSLALAAAGLLTDYDATSHWAVAELLPLMGARHIDRRVVVDRNRMTGGGATAGIDFGLTLAAKLMDEEAARRVQLILEYAPEPPFRNGTPAEAGPERVAQLRARRPGMDRRARLAVGAAAARLAQARRSQDAR